MRVRPVGYGPWAQISCSVRRAVLPKPGDEPTGRQHAIAVYRKSGLSGRAELAAFFFEDMLLLAADHDSPPAMRD